MFSKALSVAVAVAALMAAGAVAAPTALADATEATVRGGEEPAQWRTRTSMREARAEVGVAALGGRVYVVGGTLQRGEQAPEYASTLVTSYDPRDDRWRRHAPLPRPLTHVGLAALDGKLYAVGGFTDIVHIGPQSVAYVYSPRSNRWKRLPDIPERLGSVGVAAAGGKLHLIGGRDSREVVDVPGTGLSQGFGTVTTHLVYDPARRSWSRATELPGESRDHVGIAVLGRNVHVFGGRVADVADNLARHDVYNTRTRKWRTAAPLPTPRSAGAAVVLAGRIVYAGGECTAPVGSEGAATFEDVTAYDPRRNRWTALPALPQARHAFGAGRVGGRGYFIGGALTCGGGASADTLELALTR